LKGEINVAIQNGDLKKPNEPLRNLPIFSAKDHFFLELHDHGLEAQHLVNAQLKVLAKGWTFASLGSMTSIS